MRYKPLLALFILILALLCCQLSAEPAAAAAAPNPLPYVDGSWTLVLLPDIQNYSTSYPDILTSQVKWILDNKKSRNIAFVSLEGDITNRNNTAEWGNARYSLSMLDNKVPYALVQGNHDTGTGGKSETRETMLNIFFPVAIFEKDPTFGGVFEKGKIENNYNLFNAGGRDWLALNLEWAPRDVVVAWANKVLDKYPNRTAIITTHAYLYSDNARYDKRIKQTWNPHSYPTAKLPGGVNDGEDLWQKLVSKHKNVAFVFCGHVLNDGAGRLDSQGINGNTVHQILANYQTRAQGGEGYLRLVEFLPDGKTVQVKTYSPYLDKYMTDDEQQFVLEMK